MKKQKREHKHQKLYKLIFFSTAVIITLLFTAGCVYGYTRGIFSSPERFSEFIGSFGIWSHIVFLIVETVSVVILILPCAVGYPAATMAFGPLVSFILNAIATIAGSVIIFALVRKFGQPLMETAVSKKHRDKYEKLKEKTSAFEKVLSVTLLLPFLPDNVLCYIAGITEMSFKKFLLIVILFKPWKILFYTYGVSFSLNGLWELISRIL